MPIPTEDEKVVIEIARQLRPRAEAIARMRQRALGSDDVSDARARDLWNKRNENPVAQEAIMSQGLAGWEATKVLYPYRAPLLDAAKNRGGVKEVIRFEAAMSRQPKEQEVPDVSRSAY